MITRSTVRKVLTLFAFSLLCFLWSCDSAQPAAKGKEKDKPVGLNIHLVLLDSSNKPEKDTIYKFSLAAGDTFHIKQFTSSTADTKTGGSSRCSVTGEVWKDDDDDDKDDKN